jgi:hypothetical protein
MAHFAWVIPLYVHGRHYSTHGDYNGTLSATGGTLTGTQVLTRENIGDGGTRTCKVTFLKVELPGR